MSSKRRLEGYLLIDNRHAPALDAGCAKAIGKDLVLPGLGTYESATVTCSHCHAIVVLNPGRTREREWCWNCDKYLCDSCGAWAKTHACVPMNKMLDTLQTQAFRDLGKG